MQLRANRGTEMESEGENSYAADQGETQTGYRISCGSTQTCAADGRQPE